MDIVRYIDRREETVRVGLRQEGSVKSIAVRDLADLLSRSAAELPGTLSGAGRRDERDQRCHPPSARRRADRGVGGRCDL